jgi:hypothetical protein
MGRAWAGEARAAEAAIALLVVPHGLTDLWSLPAAWVWPAYAGCGAFCAACPAGWLAALGLCGSVVHFAGDLGFAGACLLVGLCVALQARGREAWAYRVLLAFMVCVHLPAHYGRCAALTPAAGWVALVALGLASLRAGPLGLLRGSAAARRGAVSLVCAHALVNAR